MKEIAALFDTVDSAEFALSNLQALGIDPLGYKMHRQHHDVTLRLTVEDAISSRAQSALISNHGRQVRLT